MKLILKCQALQHELNPKPWHLPCLHDPTLPCVHPPEPLLASGGALASEMSVFMCGVDQVAMECMLHLGISEEQALDAVKGD